MGTAIFLWVERRLPSGAWSMVKRDEHRDLASRPWKSFRPSNRDEEFLLSSVMEYSPQHNWVLGKNYNLFAILVDHCNNRGNERFTEYIISRPRGWPSDVSNVVFDDASRGVGSVPLTRTLRQEWLFQADWA